MIHAYIHTYIFTHTHTHIHIYIYVNIYMYTQHTHTQTDIHTSNPAVSCASYAERKATLWASPGRRMISSIGLI
jgi:hypothetical protein